MTVGEFRAFVEGMDIKEAPTPEQWARISERLEAVSEPIPDMPGRYHVEPLRLDTPWWVSPPYRNAPYCGGEANTGINPMLGKTVTT